MILTKTWKKVKDNREAIFLGVIIFLICLFVFSLGWILVQIQTQNNEQLKFYDNSTTFSDYNGWQSAMG